jgi:hypothetical protein
MFRFTIRDMLWLMVVVGMGVVLWIDRRSIRDERASLEQERATHAKQRAVHIKKVQELSTNLLEKTSALETEVQRRVREEQAQFYAKQKADNRP